MLVFFFLNADIPWDLFKKDTKQYNLDQRDFAVSLHLQSPKAYEYLRTTGFPLPSLKNASKVSVYFFSHLKLQALTANDMVALIVRIVQDSRFTCSGQFLYIILDIFF